MRRRIIPRNSGANKKSNHVPYSQCQASKKDARKVTNVVFTYTSTCCKTSDEAKCILTTTNFLYFKLAILFIL